MDGGCVAWHCLRAMWRWLFVDECKNAAALLSVSFAINFAFARSSLSRFNLYKGMRRLALRFVKDTLDDKFLDDIGRLSKSNRELAARLGIYSRMVEQFVSTMEEETPAWKRARHLVTVSCAVAAFACMAFEMKTRIGVALALPYLLLLLVHAIWTLVLTMRVLKCRRGLLKAKAEMDQRAKIDVDACAKRLKAAREALSSQAIAEKGRMQGAAQKRRQPGAKK